MLRAHQTAEKAKDAADKAKKFGKFAKGVGDLGGAVIGGKRVGKKMNKGFEDGSKKGKSIMSGDSK